MSQVIIDRLITQLGGSRPGSSEHRALFEALREEQMKMYVRATRLTRLAREMGERLDPERDRALLDRLAELLPPEDFSEVP